MNYDAIVNPFIFGKLQPLKSVTIRLVAYPGGTEITPISAVCTESPILGYYSWSLALLDRSSIPALTPGNPVTLLYVMTDSDGYQFSGKVILGDFPELVRRTYGIVQVPL